ncbi:hypothetical protein IFM47457_11036 [Aspergillus lentulus]|nr:hypothetical protein IFM47457_11036 [Aspergillus lentulus]
MAVVSVSGLLDLGKSLQIDRKERAPENELDGDSNEGLDYSVFHTDLCCQAVSSWPIVSYVLYHQYRGDQLKANPVIPTTGSLQYEQVKE